MKKTARDTFFKLFFNMIKQLIKTEELRASQLNRLGVTLQEFKTQLDEEAGR